VLCIKRIEGGGNLHRTGRRLRASERHNGCISCNSKQDKTFHPDCSKLYQSPRSSPSPPAASAASGRRSSFARSKKNAKSRHNPSQSVAEGSLASASSSATLSNEDHDEATKGRLATHERRSKSSKSHRTRLRIPSQSREYCTLPAHTDMIRLMYKSSSGTTDGVGAEFHSARCVACYRFCQTSNAADPTS